MFQIETIGDAYCVAGGLHRVSRHHAQQTAWMALKMMETARQEKAHDGKSIQVSGSHNHCRGDGRTDGERSEQGQISPIA